MKKKLSIFLLPLILSFFLIFFPPVAYADAILSVPILGEREIPEDFLLSVSTVATGHRFFDQAVAQDNGTVAICSRFTESKQDAFSRVYVDVYAPDGSFWKEISFTTQFGVTTALKDDFLNLFFYDYVVLIDLRTEEVTCYDIEPNSFQESSLRQRQFRSGEWEYRCKKSIWGYKELIRSNGKCEQVIVSYPGMETTIAKTYFSAISVCLPTLLLILFLKKCKKNKSSK